MGKTQKRARKKSSQAPGVRDGSAIAKPTHATADATTDVQVAVAAAAMAVDDARDDGARSRDVSEGTILRALLAQSCVCLLYTSPSPRDKRQSRMPSSA